jgi:multidrug efflux pump subunit AcrB
VTAAQRDRRLVSVFSTFSANTPQVHVEVDRVRAKKLGVPIENVNAAVETYFGSTYVNDFNILGRTYRVTAQADLPFRRDTTDLARLRTKNESGEMVLLGSVMDFKDMAGPDRVPRYNLYPASEIQGETAPGTSSATALNIMKELADQVLPSGFSFEWTDLSLQESTGGNAGLFIFPICVLFVYLVLAAQYGSWSLPLAVILIVPMCVLAGLAGVRFMGLDVNVLTQIGFVVHRSGWQEPGRCGDRGVSPSPAADPDDVVRVHPRGAAAGDIHRRRLGNAPGRRRRRVLRHDRRHGVRIVVHAGVLRADPPDCRRIAEGCGGVKQL